MSNFTTKIFRTGFAFLFLIFLGLSASHSHAAASDHQVEAQCGVCQALSSTAHFQVESAQFRLFWTQVFASDFSPAALASFELSAEAQARAPPSIL